MKVRPYWLLAQIAVVLGTSAMAVELRQVEPRVTLDVAALLAEIQSEQDHIEPLVLAHWIAERRSGLVIFDVHGDDALQRIPSAQAVDLKALAHLTIPSAATVVLYSATSIHAAQAWVLLRAQGHRRVFFLHGGFMAWQREIMQPTLAFDASPQERVEFAKRAALSRYFGGSPKALSASEVPDFAPSVPRRRGC